MKSKCFSKEELDRIDKADNLHIAPFREDGRTYGPPTSPTWIWEVLVDGEHYVRAYYGVNWWYQSALQQKAGRIIAAGTKEVASELVQGEVNNAVDESYKKKYRNSPYLTSMTSDRAKAATVKITPY